MEKSLNDIQKELEALEKQKRELEIEIEHVINAAMHRVAASQELNRISEHIFTIRFSDMIGQPWNPSFYDWNQSIDILKKFLRSKPAAQWQSALQNKLSETKCNSPVIFSFTYSNPSWGRMTERVPVSYQFIQEIINQLN
jgi:hypothetical protein